MSGYEIQLSGAQRRRTPSRGHYEPATGVARPSALRWVPYAVALSTVRALQAATHEDLRRRVQQLSRAMSCTFFCDAAADQRMMPPFSASRRFPENEVFICPDLAPLRDALLAVNQAMTQVAAKDASEEACSC